MQLINPMLCKEEKNLDVFTDSRWICQDKIDGIRAIIHIQNGEVKIQGRRSSWITHRYPELDSAFDKGLNCIIDGEIVTQDEDFNHIQIRDANNKPIKIALLTSMFPIKFMAFDILEKDNVNLRHKPLLERLNILSMTLAENQFVKVLPVFQDIKQRFAWAKQNNKEGIIVKDGNSHYEDGKRANFWFKVKYWKEANVQFNSYELNNAGLTVQNDKGIRVLVAGAAAVNVKKIIDEKGIIDLEIQYLEMTKNGVYRMPTYRGVK